MNVVWLTWFRRMDQERFRGLDLHSRDLKGWN